MRATLGQLVRFRAGGPVLTITDENVLDDGSFSYFCQWFEYETLRGSTFPIAALEPVEGSFSTIEKEESEMPDQTTDTEYNTDKDLH